MSKQRQLARLDYFRNMAVHLNYVLEYLRGPIVDGTTQEVHLAQMNLDFYAITALRIGELLTQAKSRSRLDTDDLTTHFKQRWPILAKHRNNVVHILDPQNFSEVPRYMGGQFIANLKPGGGVNYVIDPRYHHEELVGLLTQFQEIVEAKIVSMAHQGHSSSRKPDDKL